MVRILLGLGLGVVLVFPGIELLRWLATKVTGLYPDMTLTEACLAMIILLQSILVVRGIRLGPAAQPLPRPAPTRGHPIELRPPQAPAIRTRRQNAAPAPRTTAPRSRSRTVEEPPPPARPRRSPPRSPRG